MKRQTITIIYIMAETLIFTGMHALILSLFKDKAKILRDRNRQLRMDFMVRSSRLMLFFMLVGYIVGYLPSSLQIPVLIATGISFSVIEWVFTGLLHRYSVLIEKDQRSTSE